MGNAPAFQLFASDFYMDTISWTVEEVGIYTRLLLAQWTNGPLDNDTLRLSRISGISHKKFLKWFPKVSQKFQESNAGKVFNLRLEETRQKQKSYIESQQLKGKMSAGKRSTTVETTVQPRLQPKVNPSSSSSSSTSIKKKLIKKKSDPDFILFWESYPVKIGKEKALESWVKRNGDRPDISVLLEAIKRQVLWRENANGKFRPEWKNPTTWLNQGCWTDEVQEKEEDEYEKWLQHQNSRQS